MNQIRTVERDGDNGKVFTEHFAAKVNRGVDRLQTALRFVNRNLWGSGSIETCPPRYAVSSPPRSAAQACAAS